MIKCSLKVGIVLFIMQTFFSKFTVLLFFQINNELYDNHQKLKKAREQARSLELGFENIQERLDQEKQKNARLEQDVKNFEERERHLSKIQILQMKRPWVVSIHYKLFYAKCINS